MNAETGRVRVAVHGAAGRMGRVITRAILIHPNTVLAACLDSPSSPLIGQPIARLLDSDALFDPSRSLATVVQSAGPDTRVSADVVIDFTTASATQNAVRVAEESNAALVVGTTALDESTFASLHALSRRVAVVVSPNMSVGVTVLAALVRRAAAALSLEYDAEIVEMHHRHKLDAPSGTAVRLAEAIDRGRSDSARADAASTRIHGRHGATQRAAGEVAIHAVRGGDVVGDHTVTFAGPGERIELTHRAHSRDIFVAGAIAAAIWAHGRAAGYYSMEHVLSLSD